VQDAEPVQQPLDLVTWGSECVGDPRVTDDHPAAINQQGRIAGVG
jgi:hypothetical protein